MSTFELYSMTEAFEGSLEFIWGPHEDEPTIIANKIDLVREGLEDAELPMLASREVVVGDMQDRFDRQVGLDGKPWKKRNREYQKWLNSHGYGGKSILRKDDHLIDAVTDVESYQVVGNDLFINTTNWPVYWHIHDQGGTAGRGAKIPARPYVGISEEAQYEIIAVFDQWIDMDLQLVRPGVTNVVMFRGAFGRIAGPVTRASLIPQKRAVFMFGGE